ncbi:hypothetical protein BaRGS_00015480 [Batillaria attramentaria]|uniref:Uncharacterized protein n=1 Tax=Batillaria attramentaria TaxID=370345 RepID=A0ABD0L1S3_9CAEN
MHTMSSNGLEGRAARSEIALRGQSQAWADTGSELCDGIHAWMLLLAGSALITSKKSLMKRNQFCLLSVSRRLQ